MLYIQCFIGCFLQSAAGAPDTKGLKDQLAAAKRENNDLNTKIKQLEAEIKQLGKAGVDTQAQEVSRRTNRPLQ